VATCGRYCPRVFHVQGAADLRSEWFAGAETVGITAGTSTPDTLIDAVERRLEEFSSRSHSPSGDAGPSKEEYERSTDLHAV